MALKASAEWWSCDGDGHESVSSPLVEPVVSRRSVIAGLGLGALTCLAPSKSMAQVTFGNRRGAHDVLVSIFLRGGADGLNVVVPYAEDAYHRARPVLGLAAPGTSGAGVNARCIDLNGFFGLNPAMGALLPLYREGSLGIVHACGSGDQTRSHFEAMNSMERGLQGNTDGPSSGWLARHLVNTRAEKATPLRAVAFSRTMPDSLRGATSALAMESLDTFSLDSGTADTDRTLDALKALYGSGSDPLSQAGRETLDVLGSLRRLDPRAYRPEHQAVYPKTDLGAALSQVAYLIKADVGLEIACLDKGGWDTHFGQNVSNQMGALMTDLSNSLAAFAQDLGPKLAHVTTVTQTEFGRRLQENRSLGTDHGRASVMFLMGGGVVGGQVHANWPGLEEAQLDSIGDMRVTTDYRVVLADVLAHRLQTKGVGDVFGPEIEPSGRYVHAI